MKTKKLKKWSVNATIVGSKHLGIYEAATSKEAIKMAMGENGYVSLCHQCSGECESAEIKNPTADEVN